MQNDPYKNSTSRVGKTLSQARKAAYLIISSYLMFQAGTILFPAGKIYTKFRTEQYPGARRKVYEGIAEVQGET